MKRGQALQAINRLLQAHRTGCKTREQLNEIHGRVFSKIDGYCNRECPIGLKLQELGKHLTVRERKICEEEDVAYAG